MLLYKIFVDPFMQMAAAPDLFVQTLWEGLVAGVLYALIALGFVLIFKASGVFNFAQGIMVVFSALTLVGIYEILVRWGVTQENVAAFVALGLTIGVMFLLAFGVERIVLRPLVNQPDIVLFMATFGLTYFLIGFGEYVFGGSPKPMIADQLYLPQGLHRPEDFGRPRFAAKDRYRGGGDRLDHGDGARDLFLENAHRPGASRRRRQP